MTGAGSGLLLQSANMVEAPGIALSCTERERSTGKTDDRREGSGLLLQSANMVEAPGIEPGSENFSLMPLRA